MEVSIFHSSQWILPRLGLILKRPMANVISPHSTKLLLSCSIVPRTATSHLAPNAVVERQCAGHMVVVLGFSMKRASWSFHWKNARAVKKQLVPSMHSKNAMCAERATTPSLRWEWTMAISRFMIADSVGQSVSKNMLIARTKNRNVGSGAAPLASSAMLVVTTQWSIVKWKRMTKGRLQVAIVVASGIDVTKAMFSQFAAGVTYWQTYPAWSENRKTSYSARRICDFVKQQMEGRRNQNPAWSFETIEGLASYSVLSVS